MCDVYTNDRYHGLCFPTVINVSDTYALSNFNEILFDLASSIRASYNSAWWHKMQAYDFH